MKKYLKYLILIILFYPQYNWAENLELEIRQLLSLSLSELMQIEISTAGKTTEKVARIPASVTLVTRQEIQTYGYTTLEEILQHISGMYQVDFYGVAGPSQGMRGYLSTSSPNGNIIILINGVNQLSDYNGGYPFGNIAVPVNAIDRIEVVRGPLSTIYGSGAFFGVINIITNETESGFLITTTNGSRKFHERFARGSYVFDEGQLVFNTAYQRDDGLDIEYKRLNASGFPPHVYTLSTGGRLEKAKTYFDLSADYQGFSLNLNHTNTRQEGFIHNPTVRSGTVRQTEIFRLALGYKIALTPHWELNAKLAYNNLDAKLDYDSFMFNDLWSLQTENSKAYEAELTLNWQDENMQSIIGAYYRYVPDLQTYIDIPSLPQIASLQNASQKLAPDSNLARQAIFAQLSYSLNEYWQLITGLRLEQQLGYEVFFEHGREQYQSMNLYYPKQKLAIIPRLALIYAPNESNIIKLLYGTAINSPAFGQNTTARLNPALPPLDNEEIQTLELNYLTDISAYHTVGINIFRNQLQKLLVSRAIRANDGSFPIRLTNSGNWVSNGIELDWQARPTERTKFELNLTYQRTKDQDYPDITVGYSPKLLGQFKLSHQFNRQWNMGLSAYYVAKMQPFFDASLINADGSFGRRINGNSSNNNFVVGLNLRFQDWLINGTYVNLKISNLFNHNITYPTHTRSAWLDQGSFGPERSFFLSLGYDF
jgi:outer membrane receptor for ferrienterochelin and colicins